MTSTENEINYEVGETESNLSDRICSQLEKTEAQQLRHNGTHPSSPGPKHMMSDLSTFCPEMRQLHLAKQVLGFV